MDNHIIFDEAAGALDILDQRLLPTEERRMRCRSVAEVIDALKTLAVRGAPAIGVAAAYGCVIASREAKNEQELLALMDGRILCKV